MNTDNWKSGDKFTAKIHGKEVEGCIYIQTNYHGGHTTVYLCQNQFRGATSPNLLGYVGSWGVSMASIKYNIQHNINTSDVTDLKVFSALNRKERIQNLSL